jgi:hypothetical protein
MIDNEFQFIVVGVVKGEHFTVLGRCGDVPIHVGDVFDAVYRYNWRSRDELGDEPVREIEKPAAIRVTCIHAFDKSLQMMGEGLTGSLGLEGEGLQFLAPGWILGRKSEDTPVLDRGSQQATVLS